jgi:hypothetical protein
MEFTLKYKYSSIENLPDPLGFRNESAVGNNSKEVKFFYDLDFFYVNHLFAIIPCDMGDLFVSQEAACICI